MVKGISRKVIVIRSPDPHVFEEAIFIVRDDVASKGVTREAVLQEAQEIAQSYVRHSNKRHGLFDIAAPVYALIGAFITALIWTLTRIM